MKKVLAFLTAVLLLSGTLAISVSANRGYTYDIPYGTPKIDGTADAAWANATWAVVDLNNAKGGAANALLRVKIMHDGNYLYYLAESKDPNIGTSELIEFYVDEDYCVSESACGNFTHLSILLADGKAADINGSNSKTKASSVVAVAKSEKDGVCTIEWAFKPMNPLKEGANIGIEFMYTDKNAEGKTNHYRYNVDTAGGDTAPYKSMKDFAKATLGAKPAATTTTTTKPATSPATADAGLMIAVVTMASAAGTYVFTKKRSR